MLRILSACLIMCGFLSARDLHAQNFSNIRFGGVSNGTGHVGVDIWFSKNGNAQYNPCHNSADIYYDACINVECWAGFLL